VHPVIRIIAKKVVELAHFFVQSHPEVQLGHRELVLVSKQEALGNFAIVPTHGWTSSLIVILKHVLLLWKTDYRSPPD
jgi:hypothetical protein